MAVGLKAPKHLVINFSPSFRQYELWKLLQPDCCPHCGGHIVQKQVGLDDNGRPKYMPFCTSCGSSDLPQMILGGGAAGGGKAGLLDSTVCTPFGFRKIRDLKVGDIITSANTGCQQRIIYLHPIGEFDFYRVHFIDGTHFDCSEGHLWQLHQSRKCTKKHDNDGNVGNECVWTTKSMFEWMENKKKGMYSGCNLTIPLCAPVQFTQGSRYQHNKSIDPYVLGALLGDGCITENLIRKGCAELTSMDQEIVDKFTAAGYDMTNFQQKNNCKAKSYLVKDSQLIQSLKDMGLVGTDSLTKFIPSQYLYATIKERKELLKGLMDTNGYVDSRGHMSYSTISKQLAENVAFIVRSLGGIATIKRNSAGYNKEDRFVQCNDSYDVCIRIKIAPELVSLSRKKEHCRYEFNGSVLGKRITDIEYLGKREGRCITVNESNGLYVADDFTVTHNSYLGSCWIVSSCIRFPDIRAVVARKTLKSLKGSTFNTIKKVCKEWGLKENVNYKINNLDGIMTFWNDSVIILQEMCDTPSDPNFERFGSSEYTIAFIDEVSEISERAVEVLFSRLRWKTSDTFKTARMLMTTNPCITWVRSRFVQDDDGNPAICSEGEAYVPFSVFDNPDIQFVQTYVAGLNKIKDRATRERLLYGNWDFVDTNNAAAYWKFDGAVHLKDGLKESAYDPLRPIILSFDFNVMPHMSCLAIQIDYSSRNIYVLEEILGRYEDKENNTPRFAEKIKNKYLSEQHTGGLLVTGDPAGLARSTQTDDGVNNFTIIMGKLNSPILRAQKKIMAKQPPMIARLEFVNELLDGYDGWKIQIDMRCRKFTEDLIYQKKNEDGTKSKAKVTDPKIGVKYEKYGHLSDCFDYALCQFVPDAWQKFKSKSAIIQTTAAPVYAAFEEY